MRKIYICHPYAKNPKKYREVVRQICEYITNNEKERYRNLVKNQDNIIGKKSIVVPIASHLIFPEFMNDVDIDRQLAMDYCIELMLACDEVWVYYEEGVTSGMREEISAASGAGVTVVWKEYPREVLNKWSDLGDKL